MIFSVALSTLLLAVLWTLLGKLKLTRYVGYMPYSISEAFLACVGYKVGLERGFLKRFRGQIRRLGPSLG